MAEPERPPVVVAAARACSDSLVELVVGDRDAARRALTAVDDVGIDAWYHSLGDAATDGWARRARRWREGRLPVATRREVIARDGSRCRFCGADVIDLERLSVVRSMVGHDVLAVDGGVWLAVGGTVASVRVGRGSSTGPDNVVTTCLPCRARRDGRTLAAAGLSDPRERPPFGRAEWLPMVDALDRPIGAGRAVLSRAALLDGCTLNVAGVLVGPIEHAECLRLGATIAGRRVDRPIELLSARGRRAGFQAHLPLDELLPRSDTDLVEVTLMDVATAAVVDLVCVPGCSTTVDADVFDPSPALPGADRRLVLDPGRGVRVLAVPLPPRIVLTSVQRIDDALVLHVSATGIDQPAPATVCLRRRRDPAAPCIVLDEGAEPSTWVVPPAEALIGRGAGGSVLWDVWAAWEESGSIRWVRVARRRSDLLDPGVAVTLPAVRVRVRDGAAELVVTPYFTRSRHVAVKIRSIARGTTG